MASSSAGSVGSAGSAGGEGSASARPVSVSVREHALVVLGCALRRVEAARGAGLEPPEGPTSLRGFGRPLRRRVVRAAREWARAQAEDPEGERPGVVVASGGRSWDGEVEADAMAAALALLGVPEGVLVRERASLTTRDNARFTAACCARRGIARVALVTCVWHLPRAVKLFEAEGLEVVRQVPAGDLECGGVERAWTLGKERLLRALVGP